MNVKKKKTAESLVKTAALSIGILTAGILASAAIATCFAEPETVEYHVSVDHGDTLWTLCGKVASDKDEMAYPVWQTAKENHIVNGYLHPGQEIIIRPLKV